MSRDSSPTPITGVDAGVSPSVHILHSTYPLPPQPNNNETTDTSTNRDTNANTNTNISTNKTGGEYKAADTIDRELDRGVEGISENGSNLTEQEVARNISQSPDMESETAIKRAVARRACLACRERKIKCDGEALTQKDPPADPAPICSNCKLVGLECVFVQSMRGGRRRKRLSDVPTMESESKYMRYVEREGVLRDEFRDGGNGNYGSYGGHVTSGIGFNSGLNGCGVSPGPGPGTGSSGVSLGDGLRTAPRTAPGTAPGTGSGNGPGGVTPGVNSGQIPMASSICTPTTSFSQKSIFGDFANLKLPSPTLSYASSYYDFPSGESGSTGSEYSGSFRSHRGRRRKEHHDGSKHGQWRYGHHHFKGPGPWHRWKHYEGYGPPFGPPFDPHFGPPPPPPPPPSFGHPPPFGPPPHHGPYHSGPPFPYYPYSHPMGTYGLHEHRGMAHRRDCDAEYGRETEYVRDAEYGPGMASSEPFGSPRGDVAEITGSSRDLANLEGSSSSLPPSDSPRDTNYQEDEYLRKTKHDYGPPRPYEYAYGPPGSHKYDGLYEGHRYGPGAPFEGNYGPPPHGPPPHGPGPGPGPENDAYDPHHLHYGRHGPGSKPPHHGSHFKRPHRYGSGPGSYRRPEFDDEPHNYIKGRPESLYSYDESRSSGASPMDRKKWHSRFGSKTETMDSKDLDSASESTYSQSGRWEKSVTSVSERRGKKERTSSQSSIDRQIGISNLSVNDAQKSYSDTLSVHSGNREDKREISGGSAFSVHLDAYELEENDLPCQMDMQELLDFYYEYIQPRELVLPPKNLFLKWVPLSSDSSVYHALIATVCQKRAWKFSQNPRHWVEKMHKFWDNLSDYGMVLCSYLMCHTRDVFRAPQALLSSIAQCWDYVHENRYMETLNKETTLNARKSFERESLLYIIWSLSVGCLCYQAAGGYPYTPAQIGDSGPITVGYLKEKIPFPLPNAGIDPAKTKSLSRISVDDYNKKQLDNISCVMLAVEHSSQVLDQIGKEDGSIGKGPQFLECEALKTYFSLYTYRIEKDLLIIDSCVVKAQLIKLRTDLMQYEHLLKAGLFGCFSQPVTSNTVPDYNASDLKQIQNTSNLEFIGGLVHVCRKIIGIFHMYQGYTQENTSKLSVGFCGSEKPLPELNSWVGMPLHASLCAHSLARAIPILILFWETLNEPRKEAFGDIYTEKLQQWLDTTLEYLQQETKYGDPDGVHAGIDKISRNLQSFRTLARGVTS